MSEERPRPDFLRVRVLGGLVTIDVEASDTETAKELAAARLVEAMEATELPEDELRRIGIVSRSFRSPFVRITSVQYATSLPPPPNSFQAPRGPQAEMLLDDSDTDIE